MFSWVAIDRGVEQERASNPAHRKKTAGRPLRSHGRQLTDNELVARLQLFDVEMDPPTLEQLCAESLSAEEIAEPLIEKYVSGKKREGFESDWIWICLCALWERWFPERPLFEMLDDKMQAGYELRDSGDAAGACSIWLGAWKDVLHIIDKARIESIREFDDLFKGTQMVFNWVQDLQDELLNAASEDRQFLTDRAEVCEEGLRRLEEAAEMDRYADSIRQEHEINLDRRVVRQKTTLTIGGEGLPIGELPKAADALSKLGSGSGVKIGRNERCPCGSGKKYKKCCG